MTIFCSFFRNKWRLVVVASWLLIGFLAIYLLVEHRAAPDILNSRSNSDSRPLAQRQQRLRFQHPEPTTDQEVDSRKGDIRHIDDELGFPGLESNMVERLDFFRDGSRNLRNGASVRRFLGHAAHLVGKATSPSERVILIGGLVSNLVDYPEPAQALDWVMQENPALHEILSKIPSDKGETVYTELFEAIAHGFRRSNTSEDLVEITRNASDPERRSLLQSQMGPFIVIQTESLAWLDTIEDSKIRVDVEKNTIRRLALARYNRDRALDYYLDDQIIMPGDKDLADAILSEGWFFSDAELISARVAAAPLSSRRDTIIARMVELIAEEQPAAAREWNGEIDDPALRRNLPGASVAGCQ